MAVSRVISEIFNAVEKCRDLEIGVKVIEIGTIR